MWPEIPAGSFELLSWVRRRTRMFVTRVNSVGLPGQLELVGRRQSNRSIVVCSLPVRESEAPFAERHERQTAVIGGWRKLSDAGSGFARVACSFQRLPAFVSKVRLLVGAGAV